jgi:hypothetical protein
MPVTVVQSCKEGGKKHTPKKHTLCKKEVALMKRIMLVLTVVLVMAALMVASAMPAFAAGVGAGGPCDPINDDSDAAPEYVPAGGADGLVFSSTGPTGRPFGGLQTIEFGCTNAPSLNDH